MVKLEWRWNMDKLEFSTLQILINNQLPTQKSFEEIESSFNYQEEKDEFLYLGASDLTEQYLWVDFSFGKSSPRPQEIIDEKTFKKSPNPRSISQIEPTKQLFALIHFTTGRLFLSNIKKKTFIESFLRKRIKQDISIKTIFKSLDDFYKQIKIIDKIYFTSVERNLFSGMGDIQHSLQDNYGIEEPEEFSVEAKFHKSLGCRMKNSINKLQEEKQNGRLKSVIIQGLDDQGFSHVFNEGEFTQKIEISSQKDKDGLYVPIAVKDQLWKKISK